MTLYTVGMDFSVHDVTGKVFASSEEMEEYASNNNVQYFWYNAPSLYTKEVAAFFRAADTEFLLGTPIEKRVQYGDVRYSDDRVQFGTIRSFSSAEQSGNTGIDKAMIDATSSLVISIGLAFCNTSFTDTITLMVRLRRLGAMDLRYALFDQLLSQAVAHMREWNAQLAACQDSSAARSGSTQDEARFVSSHATAMRQTLKRHSELLKMAADNIERLEAAARVDDGDDNNARMSSTAPCITSVVYEGAEIELGLYLRMTRRKHIYEMTKRTAKLILTLALAICALRHVDVYKYSVLILRAGAWATFFCSITLLNIIVRINENP